jgi:hypothetical protein
MCLVVATPTGAGGSLDSGAPPTRSGRAERDGVLYRENWEQGRLGSEWGAQCNNLTQPTTGTRGSFTVQRAITGQGRWAARFDLPTDSARPTACEILHNRTLDLDTDDYFALELYFPNGWKEPAGVFWGLILAQLNYQGITGPSIGLAAHGNYVNLVMASGYFNGSKTRWYTGNGAARGNLPRLYAIHRPLRRGAWHQLVLHVRWSVGSDGAIDVWHRLRGQRKWEKTVRFRGYPTVQWSQTNSAITSNGTTDKIGAYRPSASFPISVFNDGFCRASSFRAAQSCLR